MRTMRLPAAMAVSLLLCGYGSTVFAQDNPTADQIINSLRAGAGTAGATRGIRPAVPAAPVADPSMPEPIHRTTERLPRAAPEQPAPKVTDYAPPRAARQPPSVNLNVQFANGSAELTPAATRTLDELGRALSSQALGSYHFRIEGHTDTVGSHDYNQVLSERRAAAVVDYLSSKFHVDRSRLEAIGMGESGLLVPTAVQTPEPRNRRVLVVNLDG